MVAVRVGVLFGWDSGITVLPQRQGAEYSRGGHTWLLLLSLARLQ